MKSIDRLPHARTVTGLAAMQNDEVRDLLVRAAKQAVELEPFNSGKRRWSEDGAKCAALGIRGVIEGIGDSVKAEHRSYHRRGHRKHEGRLCLANDTAACCLIVLEGWKPFRAMPLATMLAKMVGDFCGHKIFAPRSFYRTVSRDLVKLRASIAMPGDAKSAAQAALLTRYHCAGLLLQTHTSVGPV